MTLRVGVIGAGWVAGARYLPVLARLADVEVVVADSSGGRSEAYASDSVTVAANPAELLDRSPDLVIVCTPPDRHLEPVLDALSAGAHVLCEKPLAASLTEAEQLFAAADDAGRMLCPAHNFLWSSSMRRARRMIRDAGDTSLVLATQFSSDDRRLPSWSDRLPGGLLADEIPHLLYLMRDLLGGRLEVLDVHARWEGRASEPRHTLVRFEGPKGLGQATIVFGTPISEWHVSAVCPSSVVDIDLFRDVAVSTRSDGAHGAADVARLSTRVAAGHLTGFAAAGARLAAGRQFWGHDGLVRDMVSAVEGGGSPPVDRESALDVVAAAEKIVEALGAGD